MNTDNSSFSERLAAATKAYVGDTSNKTASDFSERLAEVTKSYVGYTAKEARESEKKRAEQKVAARQKYIYGDTDRSGYKYQTTAEYDTEIKGLEEQRQAQKKDREWYNYLGAAGAIALSSPAMWGKTVPLALDGQKGQELQDQIDALKAERNLLERATYMDTTYGGLKNNADWAEKSVANQPTKEGSLPAPENTVERFLSGIRSFVDENVLAEGVFDELYWATDEEKATHNYLLNTGGESAAEKYKKDLQPLLNKRATMAEQWDNAEMYDDASTVGKVALNVATVPSNIAGGVFAGIGDVMTAVDGEYDPYNPTHKLVDLADTIRGTTAQDIYQSTYESTGSETVAQLISTGYQSGMSAADSVVGGLALGSGYLAVAGAGAATRKAKELYESGAEGWQIATGAVASGAIEALMEKIPLDDLLKMAGGTKGLKALAYNVVKQMGTEGAEEGLTEVANLITDSIIRGGNSDLSRETAAYEAEGYTPEQARQMAARDAAMDIVWATVGGMMAGGPSAAVFSGVGMVQDYQQTKALGASVLQDATGLQTAIEAGVNTARTTEAHKLAEKLQETIANGKGDSITPYQVGQLVQSIQSPETQKATALATAVKESAAQHGVAQDVSETVADIAAGTGRPITFGELADVEGGNAIGGQYDPNTGIITINAKAAKSTIVDFLVKHELTHSVQDTRQWEQLADIAEAQMGDEAWSAQVAEVMEKRGLDLPQAEREVVANWVGDNLYRSGFVNAIVKGDANVGNAFVRTIDRLRLALGNKKSRAKANLALVERLFMRALEQEQTLHEGDVEYAILKDINGDSFVEVEDDILTGIPEKDIPRILSNIIQKKFHNLINVNGQGIVLNQKTNREWRMSKSAQALRGKDPQAYVDKLQSFNNADELLKAAKNYIGEAIKHTRKDNFVEFARGTVNFRVAANGYSADIIVGTTSDGRAVLYDIINITRKKITDAPNTSQSQNSTDRHGASVTNTTVAQNAPGVNTQSMQNRGKHTQNAIVNRDWMQGDTSVDRMGNPVDAEEQAYRDYLELEKYMPPRRAEATPSGTDNATSPKRASDGLTDDEYYRLVTAHMDAIANDTGAGRAVPDAAAPGQTSDGLTDDEYFRMLQWYVDEGARKDYYRRISAQRRDIETDVSNIIGTTKTSKDILEISDDKRIMKMMADINKMITPYEKKILDRVPQKEGYFDFAAHGSPNSIVYGSPNRVMSAREVARVIQHNATYNGEKVRLLSCNTGSSEKGFAQQLANALGVEVEAPSDILLVYPDGRMKIGYDGSGLMKTFKPIKWEAEK